eukprot:CAMPEP_0176355972 /NCGR_PEP_ID=MMETSP0126-20121128/13677_1 /TAXON_ID=141414 ORGANISM="Strombidinopsis acuminatum, Strain SPMC142" /NCGR_SAMPLE_ID=MMETSP0126 /ASSEMBLY_ACC=CAM_ASM_000229 /LENGTH=46 /DNA_ID= /DNA_START= /DNA_END= /DNA_ORIENTATION=
MAKANIVARCLKMVKLSRILATGNKATCQVSALSHGRMGASMKENG